MPRPSVRLAVAVAAASALLGSRSVVRATTYTWVGPFTGTGASSPVWSNPASWSTGTVPASAVDTQLIFPDFDGNTYSAINNVAGPFNLNNVTATNLTGANVTVGSVGSDYVQLTGSNPSITTNSTGAVVVGSLVNGSSGIALSLAPTAGTTTINGGGNGIVTLGSTVAPVAGTGGLTVATTGLATITVLAPAAGNTFTGGVAVNSGVLAFGLNSAAAFGANTLTFNGGGLAGSSVTAANPVVANADLRFVSGTGTVLAGVVSGPAGVRLNNGIGATGVGSQGLTLSAANTYAGTTTIDSAPIIQIGTGNLATLTVAGTLAGTSAIAVGNGGTLAFTGSSADTRVPNSAPVALSGARLAVSGLAAGSAFNETFGPVTANGINTFTISPQTSGAATTNTLTFGTLTAANNPTLFFRGTWLGTGSTTGVGAAKFGAGFANVYDPAAVTPNAGTATGLVPFAAGSPSATAQAAATFVTYNAAAGSIQLVAATNAALVVQAGAAGFGTATAHQNVNLSAATTTTSPLVVTDAQPVNALATTAAQYLTGTGTVSVYSGAVVAGAGLTLAGPTLDFGPATGYVHLGGQFVVTGGSQITGSAGVVLSGAISGSGGIGNLVTQFSAGNAANPFTGGLTVNGATLQFTADAQLGAAGGGVTLNGGSLVYNNAATAGVTVGRPITIGPAGGGVGTLGSQPFTLAGNLTGPGGLSLASGAGNSGTVLLTGTNTYAGPTYVSGGTLAIGADANVGLGPIQLATNPSIFNAPALQFASSNTFNHAIVFLAGNTLDTNGFSPTLAGTLSGSVNGQVLTKVGDGTLTLAGAAPQLSGQFNISAGSAAGTSVLSVAGNGSFPQVVNVTANAGAEFRVDNTTTNLPDRLGDYARVTLPAGGTFHYVGNAAAASGETFGGLLLSTAGTATVNVEPATATLTASGTVAGPGTLAKVGTGTLVLSDATVASTFYGGLAVNAGTVRTAARSALGFGGVVAVGTSPGSTAVNPGGTLDLGGQSITEPVTLAGGSLLNSSATPATLTSGVKGIGFSDGGVGYASTDTITFASGTGASASPVLGLTAASFTVTNAGDYSNLSTLPAVNIAGGGGIGAAAKLSTDVNGGLIFTVTNPGSGYAAAPTITLTGGSGAPNQAGTVSGNATGFTVVGLVQTAAGTGYDASASAVVNSAAGSGLSLNAPVVSPLTLSATSTVGGTGDLTVQPGIAGPGGLVKVGPDTLTLTGPGSYSGGTTVTAGTLSAANGSALGTAAVTLAGGTLNLAVSVPNDVAATSGPSTLSAAGVVTVGNLSVASGATLRLAATASARAVVTPTSLTINGTLDVATDDLDVPGGSLSALTAAAATGYANGKFTGPGLTSSAAANARHTTAVGVVANNDGSGNSLFAAAGFDGATPGVNDILVKYTYFGDANLDGVVNGADYVRIDAGYAARDSGSPLTGWYNGDFNYDGRVDGSDYTLIDNAFNLQAGRLTTSAIAAPTAEVAGGTAVPEPTSIALLTAVAAAGLGRRSRRC